MGKILTKHGEREQLAKLFRVSRPTVNSALRGATKSALAKKIRKVAIDRGGMEEKPKEKSNENT